MKSKFSLLSLLVSLTIVTFSAVGAENNTPTVWEEPKEGISMALTLSNHSIVIQIKNNTVTPKKIIDRRPDSAVKVFFIADSGTRIRLGKRPQQNDSDEAVLDNMNKASGPIILPPHGEIPIREEIPLTDSELLIIRSHPILCSFSIANLDGSGEVSIESSPKYLMESGK